MLILRARDRMLAVAVYSTATLASAQDVITQEQLDELEHSHSRLTDVALPLQYDLVPDRPQPVLEIGNPYQGTGVFEENIFTRTGAVLQPSLLIWGTYRTAFNATVDGGGSRDVSEWANRLDLFGEYRLTGTERFVVGFRPLDKDGVFRGYDFEDNSANQGFNGNVRTLFFEGDFGEIFPKLDPDDSRALDYGFSIGRQPLFFQNGVMINDILDAVGVTRNSKRFWGLSNARFTALVAWGDIDHGRGGADNSATLMAFLTEVDTKNSTIELDLAFGLSSDGSDGTYAGYGSTQRIGPYNTTFRANASIDMDDVGSTFVDDGLLVSAEISKTLHHSEDLVYLNTFLGIDSYRSAAQSPASAGPLAATGILFAGTGIGTAGSALGGFPDDSVATAFGIQKFFNGGREQLTGELGGRYNYSAERAAIAAGGRWQRAWGQHTIFAVDLYAGFDDAGGATGGFDGSFVGTRLEMLIKF